jgi:LysM repeat protein
MKKQLQKFKKFFLRTKKMNATAVSRRAVAESYDDEEPSTRLSSAFVVVLLLHVVAVAGVIAFSRIKENRKNAAGNVASIPAQKGTTPARKEAPSEKTLASVNPEALVAPEPATRVSALTGGRIHRVQPLDSLTKIAATYHVTVPELAAANGLRTNDPVKEGQTLNIPEPTTTRPTQVAKATEPAKTSTQTTKPVAAVKASTSYTVRQGDNTVKIARELGVNYDELVRLNNIKDPKKIQPGQVLKLPTKKG